MSNGSIFLLESFRYSRHIQYGDIGLGEYFSEAWVL